MTVRRACQPQRLRAARIAGNSVELEAATPLSLERYTLVLDARRIADDGRIGTLINFGAHPTMIPARETMLSRDFCGYLVEAAQQRLGAPVLFVQGAVGDASVDEAGLEYGGYPPTLEDRLRAYGERIAVRAVESMAEQVEVAPEIHTDRRAYEVMI